MRTGSAEGSPAPSAAASRSAKKPGERLEVGGRGRPGAGVPVELEMLVGFRNLQPLRKGKRDQVSPTAPGLEKRKGGETAGCDGGGGVPNTEASKTKIKTT